MAERPGDEPTAVLPVVTDPIAASAPEGEAAAVPPSGPVDEDSTGSVVRNTTTMAIGSVVSRVTGYLRAAALAAALGGQVVGDDYNLANNLPNMVYELLLGGVLASVLVPVLVRARKEEPDRGDAYAQRLLTLAVVALGAATLLVVLAAPLLTTAVTLDSDRVTDADRDLITLLAYLLLPEIFFYGLAGIFAAILNTRGHFAAPMWTPILNNIVVIVTAGTFAVMRFGDSAPTPESIRLSEVLVLGIGTTLGIVIQAFGLWPALRRVGFRWRWRFDFRRLHLRELARLGSWMLLYVGVSQIGTTVVLIIAKQVGAQGEPGPIIYNNAFLIFMMAHGIVAVSVITAMMPRMSSAAADGRMDDLADHLSLGTRLAAVILVPAAALYISLGRPMAVTLFELNNYTHEQAVATGWVITVAGLGLVPYAISQLQTFAFFALRDTRTPALLNIPVVGVRIVIDVVFYLVLPAAWVTASLMGGTAASFVVAAVVGALLLRRRTGPLGLRRIADTLLRLGAAAGASGLAAFGLTVIIERWLGDGKFGSAIMFGAGTVVLLAGYVGLAVLLRVREVTELGRMVRRRGR
jgi:putative peptidoglycan lipid II flippase